VGGVTRSQDPPRDGEGDHAKHGGGGHAPTLRRPETYEARRARRDLSLPEALLWQRLKGSPEGIPFRKQHPIGLYRADFYCAPAKLVIEVDGIAHDMGDRPQRDEKRAAGLELMGYMVLRIPAADVLRNPDEIAESLIALARSSPGRGGGPAQPVEGAPHLAIRAETPLHHQPAAGGPPPHKRGGSNNA
jgi:very-short-patch-repair endonuclease